MTTSVFETGPDSLTYWMERYQTLAVRDIRSEGVVKKIALHLARFLTFFKADYGHDHISACLKRDVLAWQAALQAQGYAPATVNNHLASLSGFASWVQTHNPRLFAKGNPTTGIGELGLPALEPRALSETQVRSLKNLCDRLEGFYRLKGRRWAKSEAPPLHTHARPLRDRAIVFVLLATGLRREELVQLLLAQVQPNTPELLRKGRKARIVNVRGKGKTERTVFLSVDARQALAAYLEEERPRDENEQTTALFLSAIGPPARTPDGQLSPRNINRILARIGRWHDAEQADPARHISPLCPHDLRHTFAFRLAQVTGADAYELERRLGHRSQRYIQRYTNPPEEIAASYVEDF